MLYPATLEISDNPASAVSKVFLKNISAVKKKSVSRLSVEKYFVSIICRNNVDSMGTVWRVILFMKILW